MIWDLQHIKIEETSHHMVILFLSTWELVLVCPISSTMVYPGGSTVLRPYTWEKKTFNQKIRINTEEKAKVVDVVWGICNLFNSLLRYLFCTRTLWRTGWISPGLFDGKEELILFFKSSQGKIDSTAGKLINSVPQTTATTFAFSSVSILILCF